MNHGDIGKHPAYRLGYVNHLKDTIQGILLVKIHNVYSHNQKTVEQEDDINAIIDSICCG